MSLWSRYSILSYDWLNELTSLTVNVRAPALAYLCLSIEICNSLLKLSYNLLEILLLRVLVFSITKIDRILLIVEGLSSLVGCCSPCLYGSLHGNIPQIILVELFLMLHDFLREVRSAERALWFILEPFKTTVSVEVMLWIALKDHYIIFISEFFKTYWAVRHLRIL